MRAGLIERPGLGEIEEAEGAMDFDQLRDLIQSARSLISDLTPNDFDGRGGEMFTMDLGVIKPDLFAGGL